MPALAARARAVARPPRQVRRRGARLLEWAAEPEAPALVREENWLVEWGWRFGCSPGAPTADRWERATKILVPVGNRRPHYEVVLMRHGLETRLGCTGETCSHLDVSSMRRRGVLSAGHAEVESTVEGFGRSGRVLVVVFVTRQRHGVGHRLPVGENEVLKASGEDTRSLEREGFGRVQG